MQKLNQWSIFFFFFFGKKIVTWFDASIGSLTGGGGTHIRKGYGDVPRSWPPFFRPVAAP